MTVNQPSHVVVSGPSVELIQTKRPLLMKTDFAKGEFGNRSTSILWSRIIGDFEPSADLTVDVVNRT